MAAALAAHFQPQAAPDPAARGGQGVAIDGKAQRGRLRFQSGGSLVHVLAAFCHLHYTKDVTLGEDTRFC